MRRAFIDRNSYLGDPAFVEQSARPLVAQGLRGARSAPRSAPTRRRRRGGSARRRAAREGETTHYSVDRRDGNAVAVTYTINGDFGAGVIAPGTGFFLNDEMDDFTVKPGDANLYGLVQGEANAIAPGKRPLSSMAPTLVEKDGRVVPGARLAGRLAHHHHGAGNRRST